jgi:Fibronectin type III domain
MHCSSSNQLEEHIMSKAATQQNCLRWTRVTETARKPLHLTAIVTGLLLLIMPFLTGCGTGENGNQSTASSASATAALSWDPVTDPSVSAYFVHYGRQSPGQVGSCIYEHSVSVDSSSATVTNLDPNTLYYFTVSAYNGLESACSNEVSIVTSPDPIGTATAPATFS